MRSPHLLPLLGCTLLACTQERPAVPEAPPFEGRTTDGTVALQNLDAGIEGRLGSLNRRRALPGERATLVDLLLARTRFLGRYSDFDRAFELAEAELEARPEDGASWRLRAQVRSAVHDFDGALEDLARADALGVDTSLQRSAIAAARGPLDNDGLAALGTADDYEGHIALAAARASRAEYAQADLHFQEALRAYRDVSPFPVSWVAFQRGVMWSEAADFPQVALPLYEEAVARLPGYVQANVHLAELEAPAEAIARLQRVRADTEDPEPTAVLAALLWDRDPTEAQRLAEEARAAYEALLARYPDAFRDHAIEFYQQAGNDPGRVAELESGQ